MESRSRVAQTGTAQKYFRNVQAAVCGSELIFFLRFECFCYKRLVSWRLEGNNDRRLADGRAPWSDAGPPARSHFTHSRVRHKTCLVISIQYLVVITILIWLMECQVSTDLICIMNILSRYRNNYRLFKILRKLMVVGID